jgi:tRNA-splicing ligase RtcB
MFTINGKFTTAKVMIDDVEETCVSQITQLVNHSAFTNPIAIMVDCHAGKSSPIGFTMPMTSKIIPAVVSVDIGCGMLAINIGKSIPLPLEEIDLKIRQKVPFGMNFNDKSVINMERDFPWKDVNTLAHKFSLSYNEKFRTNMYPSFKYDFDWFEKMCKRVGANLGRIIKSINSLGSGNHFLEFGKDLNDDYWFVIHTGSRNLGKCICDYWQHMASKVIHNDKQVNFQKRVEEIRQNFKGMDIKEKIKEARIEFGLDDYVSDALQYLEGEYAHGYLYDMIFAQKYAEVNRAYIASSIIDCLRVKEYDRIETVHNFIDFRDFIIRKGAIRSYEGERMIIPGSPSFGSLICEGKSNTEWNCSAPHGFGRLMSRAQAKRNITDEMAKEAMKGVYASQKPKDESPLAYKNPEIIEKAIEPTAKIINRIIPILNMKAGDDYFGD